MPGRATFIETVKVRLVGDLIHYECTSGGTVLHSCMARSTAVRSALDILEAVEAADMAELGGEVVPFMGRG